MQTPNAVNNKALNHMTFGGANQATPSQKIEIQARPPPMLVKGESVAMATQPNEADPNIEESKEP